jgi:uncharacterized protein involved in high-affinity Fe2+ transport|tara:strand:- start:93 stop:263 length:171 start_codon:yes stop_codon:yes gene_type:complete
VIFKRSAWKSFCEVLKGHDLGVVAAGTFMPTFTDDGASRIQNYCANLRVYANSWTG